jgi:uncharacterized protein (DUF885 family)
VAEHWTDWSDAAFADRDRELSESLARLEASDADVDPEPGVRLNAALLARELRLDHEAINYRLHAFPVNQLMGVPNQTADGLRIAFFLTTRHRLEALEDADALIELVIRSEAHLQQLAAAISEGTQRGITLPSEAVVATRAVVSDSLRGIPVTGAPDSNAIYQRFAAWASAATHLSEQTRLDRDHRLVAALTGPLRRGYEAIDSALDSMLEHPRVTFGVWDLPGGPAFYQHCIERWSGTARPAAELHRLGLDEIVRIQREIRPLLPASDRTAGLRDVAERMRRDPDACYPTTPAGAAAYVDRARELTRLVDERLDRVTTWRPRATLEIRAVEPERQRGSLYAEFYPASADGSQPSLYNVNGGDMSRLPRSELAALTFHEGVPGHHLQICTTQERSDLEAFRRRPFLYESYCEGWAMYAEQLGSELLDDVLSDREQLGSLTRRLWMAARIAVDTGIHALRWNRAQGIRFFEQNTFAPQPMIEQEVDRISVWPAQALAYHVGYLAFRGLRESITGRNPHSVAVRDFHDRLFTIGPVPAGMLATAFAESR